MWIQPFGSRAIDSGTSGSLHVYPSEQTLAEQKHHPIVLVDDWEPHVVWVSEQRDWVWPWVADRDWILMLWVFKKRVLALSSWTLMFGPNQSFPLLAPCQDSLYSKTVLDLLCSAEEMRNCWGKVFVDDAEVFSPFFSATWLEEACGIAGTAPGWLIRL